MKKNKLYTVILLFGTFLLVGALVFNILQRRSLGKIASDAQFRIEEKLKLCENALVLVSADILNGINEPDHFFETENIALYFHKNKKLIYWNNTNLSVNVNPELYPFEKGYIKLPNGYFIYRHLKKDSLDAIALVLLKPQYLLQNNYLNNSFEAWTGIPREIDVDSNAESESLIKINDKDAFSLKGNENFYYADVDNRFSFFAFVFGLIFILLSILLYVKTNPSPLTVVLLTGGIIVMRFIMINLKWPDFLYRTAFYDVRLFGDAQSYLNGYLGDMLLNSIVLFFVSLIIYFSEIEKKIKKSVAVLVCASFLLFLFNQFNITLVSAVTNSTLNFDFTRIFNVKPHVLIVLLALNFYSLGCLILVIRLIKLLGKNTKAFLPFFAVIAAITVFQVVFFKPQNWFEVVWFLAFSVIIFACSLLQKNGMALMLGVNTILISIISSVFLNFYITKNQNQELEILSLKLSEKTDPILESEYAGIPDKINKDENLGNLINLLPNTKEVLEQSLRQKYFSGYFDRYSLEFSLFDNSCKPLLDTKQPVLLNEGFFEDKINFYSDSVMNGLFFVIRNIKNSQYIGKIKIKNYNLYVLMEPKQFEELGSFPDLLLDQSLQKQDKLKNFSYVVYQSQQSSKRYGNFNYPYFFQDSTTLTKTNKNYTHFYFKSNETTDIIISKQSKNRNYFFTYNSYLLLFFSFITYSCYLIYAILFTSLFINSSLTRRIQSIIVLLLLVAMSAVGITSGRLVINQFENDNKKQLHDKTDIIISELSNQYTFRQLFDESQKELFNLKIKEYSRLFNTPISLFNKTGQLFNTSEPKLYDLGLAASLVNADAFYYLTNNLRSSMSVNEKAGTLNYLSYYTPLFDSKKQIAGFINLPYFAKQSDLTDELSGIISALINVYVILFVLSIVAGLILAGYITRPLQLIKQQFSKITFDKQNEKLVWPSNDEIGKLVFEYNQMLTKLEDSANRLAKSEREGAWREMAKQVAHEIKNPLTPMKLNLQYLQHLMKNNPQDFKEKFEKASVGIIEQIDSLANIASEFSNFAKLPSLQLQTINLTEIINTSVLIFDNQKNLNITNNCSTIQLLVRGDKDQCLRVFNNIFKNAQQALEDTESPHIEINCVVNSTSIIISIHDNGCGIDELLKEKIFTPNFTTKSTGSGLGLAMAKNSIEGFGGKIWFDSEKNNGTVFYLEFKKTEDNLPT